MKESASFSQHSPIFSFFYVELTTPSSETEKVLYHISTLVLLTFNFTIFERKCSLILVAENGVFSQNVYDDSKWNSENMFKFQNLFYAVLVFFYEVTC